ncbi:hypothetical protein BH11MYX2_BH11MYX2_05480 [soil metagenome]
MNCPPSHELSRAISDGADPNLDAHLAACPSCTKEWTATREMIELARTFTAPLPSTAHREDIRTGLLAAHRTASLADSIEPRRRVDRRVVIAGIAALAASLAIYLVSRSSPTAAGHLHGSINALVGARYDTISSSPDERVMLYEGSIDVQVSKLHQGERFRVMLGDAEVEVHGTRFIATAEHGMLVGVVVDHGIVEVRPRVGETRLLHAGESWRPTLTARADSPVVAPPVEEPPATVEESVSPRPARSAKIVRTTPARSETPSVVSHPPPVVPEVPPPVAAQPTQQERAYDDGWTAMRTGKFDDAATAFRRVLLLDPAGPLAVDSTYWNAVALARSKQNPRAVTAFRDFLERYPRDHRAGEASAMLGWLLVSQGERDEAARRFTAAIDDADAAVQTSARSGLDALKQ